MNDLETEQVEEEAVGVITSPNMLKEADCNQEPHSPDDDNEPKESDSKWVRVDKGQFFQVNTPVGKEVEDIDKVDNSSEDEGSTKMGHSDEGPSAEDELNPYASMSLERRAEMAIEKDIQDSKEEFARSCRPDSQIFDENKVEFNLVSGSEESKVKYQSDAIFAKASLKYN